MKLILVFLAAVAYGNGANILGIYTSYSPSHNIVHIAEVNALIEKGHNVTVITALPLKQKNPKYHHIFIPPPREVRKEIEESMESMSKAKGFDSFKIMMSMMKTMVNLQYDLMFTEEFQNVINGDTKFDLLILGYVMNDFQLAVAQQLKIPVVVSWVNFPMPMVNDLIGNPNAISYVPNAMLGNEQPMNFISRLKSYILNIVMHLSTSYGHYKLEQYYE